MSCFDFDVKEAKYPLLWVIRNMITGNKRNVIIFSLFRKTFMCQGRKIYRLRNMDLEMKEEVKNEKKDDTNTMRTVTPDY